MKSSSRSNSQALTDFQRALKTAEALCDLDMRQFRDPPRPQDQAAVQGLRGGAAVLMVAALEYFLRQTFEEHLGRLVTKPPVVTWKMLGSRSQVHNVYRTLELATKGQLYGAKKDKIDRIVDIEQAARGLLDGVIDPAAFSGTPGNPDSSKIKEMFKALDFDDVFAKIRIDFEVSWGAPIAQRFIPDKLDEIVLRRHVVAHTANALNVTRGDLGEAVRFLSILGTHLDRELGNFVHDLIRQAATV